MKEFLNAQQYGAAGVKPAPFAGKKTEPAQSGEPRVKPGLPGLKRQSTYYSPREYGTQADAMNAQVEAARAEMERQAALLKQQQTAMETARAEAERQRNRYYELKDRFEGDSAGEYRRRLEEEWTASVQAFDKARTAYQQGQEAYAPYEQAYNRAAVDYNAYMDKERSEYDAWRSNIRDAESIRLEMKDLGRLRTELEHRMKGGADVDDPAANETRIRELQAYLGALGEREKLLQEELEWSEHFVYEGYRQNADFAELSRYQPGNDAQYNQVNIKSGAYQQDTFRDDALAGIYWYMEEPEVAMYNYLYAGQGAEAAQKYVAGLEPELNRRRTEETTGQVREWAGKSPLNAALASAGSVLISPISGFDAAVGQLAAKARGEEIDPNAEYNMFSNVKNAVRDEVGGMVEENFGPAGSFLYSTGMSMADMLADAAVAAGNPAVASTLIGSRSFAETVIDGKERGLSDREAMSLGVASAAAELITERLGVDELLRLPKGMKDAGFWKGAFKGMLGEAGEEGLTNILNFLADNQIAGEKSRFNQSIEQHKAAGLSDRDAVVEALKEAGLSLALDTVGGGLSGGIFGGYQGWQGKRAADKAAKAEKVASAAEQGVADNGTVPSLKEAALRENNPLISGIAPTAKSQDKDARMAKATTNAQVTGILYDVSEETVAQADRIGELIGKKIFFFAENPTEHGIKHGVYDQSEDSIGVNAKSRNVMAATIGHELTHSVEDAKSYADLKNLVMERIAATGGDLQALRQQKMELYARNGHQLTEEDADREIVAKYVEDHLLTDEQSIRELVRSDRSVARRILDWLDGLMAKFGNKRSQEREFVRQARDVYRKALAESDQARSRQEMGRAMHEAYASGDDEAGDAMLDAMYGDNPEEILETDWSGYDDADFDFSFGGVKASGADLKALERAKQMRAEGVGAREILKQTGWYTGADGKWRFEIDDSGAKYRPAGDAQFRKDHPQYRRYRELERKFIDCTISDEEITELVELRSMWGNEPQRLRQIVARGNAKVYNVLEHDALYEQYPQLRDVKVRFGDTDNAGGWWNAEGNEIVLSNRYRHADPAFLELKLLHEIQHAIQSIEGFAGGSNPEYWEEVQSGDRAIRVNDRKLAKAEREAQEALKGIPPEVAKDFWYAANMMDIDPEGAQEVRDRLDEGEYSDAFWDYDWAISTVRELLEEENPKRTAMDLYRNTAGEVEAYDVMNRRGLDAEARKKRLPDTGGDDTVFVEGENPLAAGFIGWTADGNEVYQTSAATMSMSSHDRFENFKKTYLGSFMGRTAKFQRNGHTYYARFAQSDSELGKLAHEGTTSGSKSSTAGYKAKIRMLADGSVFELVEDAQYNGSRLETGVGKNKTHKNAKHWDYFVKTVIVDGKAYDVLINIRTDSRAGDYSDKEQFVYSIRFRDNKTAATPVASPATSKVLRQSGVTADYSLSDDAGGVKQYSIGEMDSEGREYTMRDIGGLQQERYQLKAERDRILMENPNYAKAVEERRYANNFKERAAASRALRAAEAEVDTARIDQRITQIDDLITNIRETERLRHQQEQEKYSGTKTRGYALLPDTRMQELDAEYDKAVKSRNRKRMQELVRQAAEAAMPKSIVRGANGKLLEVYHYTNGSFTEFDRGLARTGNEMDGFFFAPDAESTKEYGGNAIVAYLNITNPAKDPYLDRLHDDSGTLLREKLAYEGYDGVVRTEADGSIYEYMAFDPEQIKSAELIVRDDRGRVIPLSERFNFKSRDIRYSIGELDGTYTDDEGAHQANRQGYPVLKGEQVVPMRTWVRVEDPMRGPDGEVTTDGDGNVVRNSNYGLVTGFGDRPGTLAISFRNKHRTDPATGKTVRRDDVSVDFEDLTPVPGEYQMTREEAASLFAQEPERPGDHDYTDEDLAEIDELLGRAYMDEEPGAEREEWISMEPDDLKGKPKDHYDRAMRKLARDVAGALDVPRHAKREFLEPIAQEIAWEYLNSGTVKQELRDRLFETAFEQGIVVDREFYDTYKEVKDHLRTTAVTLGETDRDSRDYDEFRRRAFGTLRIVNEGGLPVDTLWGELQEMAPALFPNDILNPDDMLKHMYEVGRSIQITERSLQDYFGPDAELMKRAARNDFEIAVQDALSELRRVKRVADEARADSSAVTGADGEELTQEQITAMYPALKDARRAAEKAVAKNLLTKQDRKQVQRLLRGDIRPEHLDPGRDNVQGILAVYEAKKAFEEAAEPIRKWNRQRKARLYTEAEALVAGSGRIEDKKRGILYSRETMERNIRDIVKNKDAAERIIKTYFKPVHEGAAAAIRMKNQYRERVEALNISRKVRKGDTVSEAYAVQFYGEVSDILRMMEESKHRLKRRDGKTYLEWKEELRKLWDENPSLDKDKIKSAAREMGVIYEELFAQMNEARIRNGYEPINHRSGYFPHFQQDGRDGILAQFGKAMGIDVEVQQLPTTINGLTHTFKPGIRWFGNALERRGFDTAYDAVEGFDRYIEGVADVVHQTDNIQRLRALANQLRYRTSDEGLREQIRAIQERADLTDEEKDALIREKTKEGRFELSNFVVELDEYTGLLANKKSRADRNMEQAMGRDMYNIVKSLESRVAANMVAINPGSWLTNFIPITQGWACLDSKHLMQGMLETVRAVKTDDGIVDRSAFLTGRQGSDPLVKTWAQEWSGKLSTPMEWIDNFTAGTLVRARYRQNLAQGLSEMEAVSEADDWAAGVMADRSKGATPTLFNRSNPLTKVFTQFQLEVNNQLSYVWKDIPREKRDKGKKAIAMALLKFALGAWLYNEAYEWLFGRRPALDPADMLLGAVADVMDPELDLYGAAANLGGKIAESTPFIGGLLGGGRVPISSALPDWANLGKALLNDDWSASKKLGAAAKELAKPAVYMIPPFGGGQIKKIYEGLKMIAQGGSYTMDAKGNPLLQYPLQSSNSAVQSALEAGQAMIFGKTTIRSGREWVEGGFKNLSAEQTATYQALLALDVSQADAFALMQELRAAEKTDEQSRTEVQREILRSSGLEGDALGIVYYDLMASEKEVELMDALRERSADMGDVASTIMGIKDAADANGRRDAIMASGLDDAYKQDVYRSLISDSRDEEIGAFREAGLSMNDFLKAQNAHTSIKEQYEDEGDMATAFARWVNQQGYTAEQKAVVRESLKYWQMMPVSATRYDKAVAAGLSDADAAELAQDLDALEPPEGKSSVQDIQKWRVAVDNAWSDERQLQMLKAAGMSGKTYDKVSAAWDVGIAPAAWVKAQELKIQFDSDGNGSLTNKDWENLIDSMTTYNTVLPGNTEQFHLTAEQKGFLWQMLTGSKSTKNNPFSVSGGEKWLERK